MYGYSNVLTGFQTELPCNITVAMFEGAVMMSEKSMKCFYEEVVHPCCVEYYLSYLIGGSNFFDYKNMEIENIVEGSNVVSFVLKPVSLDILLNTLEMALLNYKRVSELSRKLKEMTENFETRKLVEMAKAILIKRDGLSEGEAYGKIRARSMDSRMPMKEIAEAIITLDEMKKGR